MINNESFNRCSGIEEKLLRVRTCLPAHDEVCRHFLRALLSTNGHTAMLIYEWTVFNLKQLIFVLNSTQSRHTQKFRPTECSLCSDWGRPQSSSETLFPIQLSDHCKIPSIHYSILSRLELKNISRARHECQAQGETFITQLCVQLKGCRQWFYLSLCLFQFKTHSWFWSIERLLGRTRGEASNGHANRKLCWRSRTTQAIIWWKTCCFKLNRRVYVSRTTFSHIKHTARI